MLRLLKLSKKHLITLAIISGAINLAGCAGVPAAPDISLHLHDQPNAVALCTKVKDGSVCPQVPIAQTNNWYMFSPGLDGWEGLSNYIDELIRRLQSKSFVTTVASPRPFYKLTLDDLYLIRKRLNDIKVQAAHESRSDDQTN